MILAHERLRVACGIAKSKLFPVLYVTRLIGVVPRRRWTLLGGRLQPDGRGLIRVVADRD